MDGIWGSQTCFHTIPWILSPRDLRSIQTLGVLGVTCTQLRACAAILHVVQPLGSFFLRAVDAQAQACVQSCLLSAFHSAALIHNLTSAWEEEKQGTGVLGRSRNGVYH